MKKIFYILTAALLLTGALLTTGCTNDDTANDNNTAKTVTFTATLAPKGGATTRAITTGKDANDKEILNVAWAVGEQISVRYELADPGMYVAASELATATITAVDPTTGTATISAPLNGPKDGGMVEFIYPATLRPVKNADVESLLLSQHGNLTARTTPNASIDDISTNFDYVMGCGTLSVNAETAAVSSNVTMENKVCICKFHFALDEGTGMGMGGGEHTFRTVTIDDGDGHIYTITSDRPDDQIGGATRGFKSTDDIYVAMLPIENKTVTFSYTETQFSGEVTYRSFKSNVTLQKGKFYRNLGTITMVKSNSVTLTSSTGELTLQNNDMLSGTGGANTRLKIADRATVTLNGLTNTDITQDNIPGIECLGDATIILAGENQVRGREYAPGIFVPEGMTLTIMGSGTLVATGGNTSQEGAGSGLIGGAGIGGTEDVSCGNIVIKGGTITATGTGWCAGIGSGHAYQANTTCGAITISGGTVTATGGSWAAGIGSGNGNNYSQDGINFTLYVSACGAISITGGTVTATGGDRAAGIGSGEYGRFASISIGSGIIRVTATRNNNYWNVPIGKGFDDQGSGAVTFGGVTMHDGRNVYRNPSDWIYWPETGGPFGGIQVSASDYGSNNGRTWTLTPAP